MQLQKIVPRVEQNVWSILVATATTHDMHIKKAGGIENHVHVLIEIPKTLSVSEAMKRLKGGSSSAISKAALLQSIRVVIVASRLITVSRGFQPTDCNPGFCATSRSDRSLPPEWF